MIREIEAVYEHGVLRPLTPLALRESQHVRLTISEAAPGQVREPRSIAEQARAEAAALGISPTIEEVRRALASIPGCLSQDVIVERGDY